jgi:hypothetical protein
MKLFCLLLALALAAPLFAQQPPCKTYFAVAMSPFATPDSFTLLTSQAQQHWLSASEPKRHPAVCFDPSEASYLIIWSESDASRNEFQTVTRTTTQPTTSQIEIHDSDGNNSQGTATGTVTETTTTAVPATIRMRTCVIRVYVIPPGSLGNMLREQRLPLSPVYSDWQHSKRQSGGNPWTALGRNLHASISGDPSERALENAIKFIEKQTAGGPGLIR